MGRVFGVLYSSLTGYRGLFNFLGALAVDSFSTAGIALSTWGS
jgi:hypothetical protein